MVAKNQTFFSRTRVLYGYAHHTDGACMLLGAATAGGGACDGKRSLVPPLCKGDKQGCINVAGGQGWPERLG